MLSTQEQLARVASPVIIVTSLVAREDLVLVLHVKIPFQPNPNLLVIVIVIVFFVLEINK